MSDGTEAVQDEYRAATATGRGGVCGTGCAIPEVGHDGPCLDSKGREIAERMTDREIAEESLILLRAFGDALQALGDNPMLRAIPGMRGMFNK